MRYYILISLNFINEECYDKTTLIHFNKYAQYIPKKKNKF